MRFVSIIIDGDLENSLGGACSRDVWNISQKFINDLHPNLNDMFLFFHNLSRERYVSKLNQIGINNIFESNLQNISKCFETVLNIANSEKEKKEKIIILYHYSGHGYQIHDSEGDEINGMDDIFLGHSMKDDFIWDNLISKLPENAHIFSLIDACHSGSGVDMPYIWSKNSWTLHKLKNISAQCSGFSLSACNDSECASQDVGETTGFSGSLTAGICDCCNFNDIFFNPFPIYNILLQRLKKLNQTVELYSVNDKFV